jgi:hypothetical protein
VSDGTLPWMAEEENFREAKRERAREKRAGAERGGLVTHPGWLASSSYIIARQARTHTCAASSNTVS